MADNYQEADRAADNAARDRESKKSEMVSREEKRIAGALMNTLPSRDKEVMAWMCEVTGKTPGRIATEMIRAALIRERRAWREAQGGGGASSTNLEALTDRLR